MTFRLLFVILCSLVFISVNAAPLSRRFQLERRDQGRCMDIVTREDIIEFHRSLDIARERWARGDSNSTLPDQDSDSDSDSDPELPNKVTFNVSFTVVYTNKTIEGGYVPADRVNAQIDRLNADFNKTGFSFVLANTTWVNNPEWFVDAYPGSKAEKAMKETHHSGDATTLNIYTVNFNATTHTLGTSTMPSFYSRRPKLDGVMLRHSTVPGGSRKNYNMGRTLTHEAGHWLGLLHTFQGGCNDGIGDNIADTPPQSSPSNGCPVGRDSCPGGGPDLINNFMDYSHDSCMDSFTPLQIVRMHDAERAFRRPLGQTNYTEHDKEVFGGRKNSWQW
jgi:hypothetical protein